ncbi:uncharacterized protein LOC119326728 isoform X2 [Triticum dicoccoides]|uniref:uncharacterized protein LOC119326728 isoform X2 n=1 Tax=Triticum dicoccoides TaxID=85692 RepID=UPI001891AF90|nr:uncharacterized protein LOC119326728 isoform X2 [Triticum dicoccoides]XP_044409334.1 uncharacterized protein LOC123134047 isoform X2 [Triticum aestivum]
MKTPSGDSVRAKRHLDASELSPKKHKPGGSSSSSGSHMDAEAPIPTVPADQINPPAADVPQPTSVARVPEDKRGTGFIISATENYALVYTSFSSAQHGVNVYHYSV